MDAHIDARYHARGQNHPADAGKPRALKGACVVWRGAFGYSTIPEWQLARCLPYPGSIQRAFRQAETIEVVGWLRHYGKHVFCDTSTVPFWLP
jgi:hypothetical protein